LAKEAFDMHPTIVLVATVPALIITTLFVWAVASLLSKFLKHQDLGFWEVVVIVLWLAILEVGISIALTVSAALSHSEAEKSRLPFIYYASAFVLVVLPAVGLFAFRSQFKKRHGKQPHA
jgi:uncharacterized membrane protein